MKQLMAENREMRNHDLISISEFRIPGVGGVKETHDKNVEIAKCETMTFWSFRYRELECRNTSPQECQNVEMRNGKINVRPCACNPTMLDTWKSDQRDIVSLHI
jgi:hypothetical protein